MVNVSVGTFPIILSDTAPAAPSGDVNVTFQSQTASDGYSLEISAYVPSGVVGAVVVAL
jgi:hypothetical protein